MARKIGFHGESTVILKSTMVEEYKRLHPFEAYMLKVYDFAKADRFWRTSLYKKDKALRSVYIFLLRSRLFDSIVELYRDCDCDRDREEILDHLRAGDLSLLIASLTKKQDQEKIIDYAFKRLEKEGYAEFVVTYFQSERRTHASDAPPLHPSTLSANRSTTTQ